MSLPTKTKQWILAKKADPNIVLDGKDATFKLETADLPELKDGDVLLKLRYLSNDPAQSQWIAKRIDKRRLYTAPVEEGTVMRAGAVAEVIESKASDISKGTLVQVGPFGWSEYRVISAKEVRPIKDAGDISPTHFLGALGLTGLTAYYGLIKIAGAKKGESVVVSGAAGAVGSMVVQIAKKLVGCSKVIGIAGSDEKCRWVESLGADACINYKNSDWQDKLGKETEDFVDVYFDNVGAEQLDYMLTRLKRNGRIAACGAIADYQRDIPGLKNWAQIVFQRLRVEGFIVLDLDREEAGKASKELTEAFKSGKMKLDGEHETVVDAKFEDIPKTYMMLYDGKNRGKLITKLES